MTTTVTATEARPGPRWTVFGHERGAPTFPTLADLSLVSDLLSKDQRAAWDAHVARLDALAKARADLSAARAEVDRASGDDAAAALAALRSGKTVAPSVLGGRLVALEVAERVLGACVVLAEESLDTLRLALVPDRARLLAAAWAEVSEGEVQSPAETRRLMARCMWALHLEDGAGPPAHQLLAAFDKLPVVAWQEPAADLLDALGAEVSAAMAESEA